MDNQIQRNTVGLETATKLAELGEELGQFLPYNPQVTPAYMDSTRIVKCCYRSVEGKEPARSNEYVRVPAHITEEAIADNIDVLMDYLIEYLESVEDKMIKEDHAKGLTKVYVDGLGINKLVTYLESKETEGRLNKDKIAVWFNDSGMRQSLMAAFAEKVEDMAIVNKTVKAYQEKFESLSGPRTYIKPEERQALVKAMEVAEVTETALGKRFMRRLENMDDQQNEVLLSL